MLIAEILSIDADDKYIDKNGSFDITKCNLITYANGKYFLLGKPIGKFGYSVQKKKESKKGKGEVESRNYKQQEKNKIKSRSYK